MRHRLFVLAAGLVLAGCGNQVESTSDTPAPSSGATSAELAGTSWQLVQITEMDDSHHVPDDGSRYTLAFAGDGSATLRLDCNQGNATWTSGSPGILQFGPVASTRAMCPPGSLHDHYLSQFEWVRSYVMRDGHLFLATMADGSIIEFEPATP